MAMRVTGLYSGLDTESIIADLVSVRQTKVDDAKKAQTKHEWKQEAWNGLNKKLKSLQTKIANMQYASSYAKKTTEVSNEGAVSVITGENAMNGTQEMSVKQLAKTAYLTGGEIKSNSGETLTATSSIKDINPDFQGGTITLKQGDKTTTIDIAEDATISDVMTELKNNGLNVNFDEKNQRLFISAKESGADNNFTLNGTGGVLSSLGLALSSGASKINGQDAILELNGATFENSNNVFEINGLTITALNTTAEDEVVTLTTKEDTEGIYDMIKDFLKEYNSVVNEMDKLYNADSAKGYEPLLDDEKEAMSETEIEKWEQKIKDSVLRRDDNLSTVNSALQTIMASGFEVNGKTMYLSDFGINTMGYFLSGENEKHAYHIDGDPDDENTSTNADKLKSMISTDSSTVIDFFTQLSKSLHTKMSELSKSRDGYRSFGSFYDDKKMKTEYTDYTSKIKELEQKLTDYEDKWYAKFSAMETALAKMQSNTNAVTSMLGGM